MTAIGARVAVPDIEATPPDRTGSMVGGRGRAGRTSRSVRRSRRVAALPTRSRRK